MEGLSFMEVRTILMAMTTSGIVGACGEKIMGVFGKSEWAQFINIAGLAGMGISALALVGKLLGLMGSL
jgi:hypothetical protein